MTVTPTSIPDPKTELRSTTEAGALLGLKHRTLENWRVLGKGPKYIKVGHRVRYRTSDLLDWLDKRTRGGEA